MSHEILTASHLCKRFDGVTALADFSCSICEGEILGLIGPNGAGKTTLFNVLTGFIKADAGSAVYGTVDLLKLPPYRIAQAGIARTFQSLRLVRRMTVLDNVMLSFHGHLGERLRNIFTRPNICKRHEADNGKMALRLLERAGLDGKAGEQAEVLSYGQQKLLSLVCCLASDARLLLLDEPVAGIAPAMIDQILKALRGLPAEGKTVVLVEHNLDAVMQVCDRVIFMDTGATVSEGTPDQVRNDPRVIEAYLD